MIPLKLSWWSAGKLLVSELVSYPGVMLDFLRVSEDFGGWQMKRTHDNVVIAQSTSWRNPPLGTQYQWVKL